MTQNEGGSPPVYIPSLAQQRRLWYTATNGDAVHRFPVRSDEIWNEYGSVPDTPPAIVADNATSGAVALRQGRLLQLIPGTRKFQYPVSPADLKQVITATFGQVAPVTGDAGPTLSGQPASGYTPVIQDANGTIFPMQQSIWIVDGANHYVEFPYKVPSTMTQPFRLTYFEYIGATGGNQSLWHYVDDTVGSTLCPDPGYLGSPGTSNFVTPLPAQSTEGNNTRLMLDVAKGAVRGGTVTAGQWDDGVRGTASAAFGHNTTASGDYSVVPGGSGSTASGLLAWAGGNGSTASHDRSYVWSDVTPRLSTGVDEVTFGASGGFRVLDGCAYLLRPSGAGGGLVLASSPAVPCAPAVGQGSFWALNTNPTLPMFTDDAGTDFNLLTSSSSLTDGGAYVPHQSLVENGVGPNLATKGLVAGSNVVLTDIGGTDVSIATAFTGPWIFYDQKSAGVPGGAYGTANTWQQRDLNLTQYTSGSSIQLAVAPAGADQLLMESGVYHIIATAPAIGLQGCRIRLYDPVGLTTVVVGESAWSPSTGNLNTLGETRARIDAVFSLLAQTVVEIQIRGQDTGPHGLGATSALGGPSSTGDPEVYTVITFYKIG